MYILFYRVIVIFYEPTDWLNALSRLLAIASLISKFE